MHVCANVQAGAGVGRPTAWRRLLSDGVMCSVGHDKGWGCFSFGGKVQQELNPEATDSDPGWSGMVVDSEISKRRLHLSRS